MKLNSKFIFSVGLALVLSFGALLFFATINFQLQEDSTLHQSKLSEQLKLKFNNYQKIVTNMQRLFETNQKSQNTSAQMFRQFYKNLEQLDFIAFSREIKPKTKGEHLVSIQYVAPLRYRNYFNNKHFNLPKWPKDHSPHQPILFYQQAQNAFWLYQPLVNSKQKDGTYDQYSLVQISFENLISNLNPSDNHHYALTLNNQTFTLHANQYHSFFKTHKQIQVKVGETSIKISVDYHYPLDVLKILFLLMIITGLYIVVYDYFQKVMAKKKRMIYNQKRYHQLLDNTYKGVIVTNQNRLVSQVNNVAEKLLGYNHQDLKHKSIDVILKAKYYEDDMENLLHQERSNRYEATLFTRNFVQVPCRIHITDIEIEGRKEYFYFIEDITKQKKAEDRIKRMAYYDALTQLENREYFQENLKRLIEKEKITSIYIFFLDLDGFKKVNDTLGHTTGDRLLKTIAKRITSAFNTIKHIHFCRFGGDEFLIAIPSNDIDQIQKMAQNLLAVLSHNISLNKHKIQISTSIGVSNYPKDGDDSDNLLRCADAAMYLAKENGKNTYEFYNEILEKQLTHNISIEARLRKAIEVGNFQLHYQPQIDFRTGQSNSVEALIRWVDDELGSVPPIQFISVAEDTGQIIFIGDWVIKEAIRQLTLWQKNEQFKDIKIAINISIHQLRQINFCENLRLLLKEANLSQDLIELELTERSVMTNAEENIPIFSSLKESGIRLSVDDFGTGCSSLSYLERFALNRIKIDNSFVAGIPNDDDNVTLTRTIINLGHNLNMETIAEGVETETQFEALKSLNCNMAQGYFFSKPLVAEDLEKWIVDYRTKNGT